MSACVPTQSKGELSVAAYEQLRQRVLAGNVIGNRIGLILLLREGLAAWISRCAPSAYLSEPTEVAQPMAVTPNALDEIHTGLVHVLVGMVLRGPGEMSS